MNIHIPQPVHLADFSVFDVGANKPYLNQGRMDHEARTTVTQNLTQLHTQLREETTPVTLSFDGDVVTYLAREQPQLLSAYKDLLTETQHTLACQPYNGTQLSLLQDKASQSITQHQQLMKQHFTTSPKTLLTTDPASADILAKTGCTANILHEDTLSAEAYLAKQNATRQKPSELQNHLNQELQAIAPHVYTTEDEELITSLHAIATPTVLNKAHPEYSETPYDHYTTIMSVLHDIAHRIQSLQNIQQGIFVTKPTIQSSPAQLLR